MNLIRAGVPGKAHVCNAYCSGDVHAQVFYRRANAAPPHRNARPGDRVLMYGRWARIVRTEAAPEAPDPTSFTAVAKSLWFFRWESL